MFNSSRRLQFNLIRLPEAYCLEPPSDFRCFLQRMVTIPMDPISTTSMPGIFGIIGKGRRGSRKELDVLVECLRKQPFRKSGTHMDEPLNLHLGWVSHVGAYSYCTPVWNARRDVGLILIGAINSYRRSPETSLALEQSGGADDRALRLVDLYEHDGRQFFEGLNGCFCGVLLDLRERPKVILFNDRYGVGRVCYHESPDGFFFASEAKALLRVLPSCRSFDLKSLGELLACGAIMQNRTLFHGISLLPAGSAWEFTWDGKVSKTAYFSADRWESQLVLGEAEYQEKLKDTWSRILPRYFAGDQPLGLSLTGGVDSRMILAWAPPDAVTCYTFGGRYRDCRDVKLARAIAQTCALPHQVIALDSEFLNQFPLLAEQNACISDGNLDASGTVDLFVQRKAREIAPVRITGTNGGEILRRLVAFKPMPFCRELLNADMYLYLDRAREVYSCELRGHPLSFTAFKQVPWYMNSKFAVERSQIALRMPYFDNDLVALSYQAPPRLAESNEPALRLIEEGRPALRAFDTDRGLRTHPVPGFTWARHALQQFTFKAEYAYDYGMPQWLACVDNALRPLKLERMFLGRHKFHHFRVWYRDELAEYVKQILLDPRTLSRPYLDGNVLEQHINDHIRGTRNCTLEIHKLLTIEWAHRKLIELN